MNVIIKRAVALIFFLGIIGLTAHSAQSPTPIPSPTESSTKPEVIVLSKDNTLIFRGPVNDASVTAFQLRAMELTATMDEKLPVYMFLDTPGGSVDAGELLISTLRALPNEVKTITNFAASMGFIFAQSLGERLVLPNGTLMAHRAKVGQEGQIPGEFNSRSAYIGDTITDIEIRVASRTGRTLEAYRALSRDEYWATGERTVKDKTSDRVVLVRCGEDLSEKYSETIRSFFGPVIVTWSRCPLIGAPISLELEGKDNASLSVEEKHMLNVVYDTLSNSTRFSSDRGLQQEYIKYVR